MGRQIATAPLRVLTRDNIPGPAVRAQARRALAQRALAQPDPPGWLAELLDALDLRGDGSRG